MSKRDYQLIADAVRGANGDSATKKAIADALATALARDYSGPYSFKRAKFLEACGVAS